MSGAAARTLKEKKNIKINSNTSRFNEYVR